MAGSKTIQLPDDAQAARQQLSTMLVNPAPYIYLFLFGDDATIQALVQKADLYAGGDEFASHRRAVWGKSFALIADCFTALPRADGVDAVDSAGTVGFTTSGKMVVAQLLKASANDADIVMAYIAAEGLA